jgi:hypothetical protein
MPEEFDRGLRIVASKKRVALSAELFKPKNPQASLFEDDASWTIVFISVSELPEGDFVNAIRYSEPCVVLDVRLAPRFDIGSLNRERVFDLFRSVQTVYVDSTSPLMHGESREFVIQRLVRHIPISGNAARRPIVFLLGRNENSSIASRTELLSMLRQTERRLDVINIPEPPIDVEINPLPGGGPRLRSAG